jgi:hypothetical protein
MDPLQIHDPEAPHSSRQEKQRLEALDQYRLRHWKDPELDRITATAAQVCSTPVALITVVDRERNWFKASHGVELDFLPRAESFCAHALDQPGLCIVPDTTQDSRFNHYAVVKEAPHVRFYAGAPLLTLEGLTLGTLCVVDVVPRNLTDSQQWMLGTLARQAMQRFERQRRKFEFNLGEDGLLPPGLHDFTLPKLRTFVCTNAHRTKLWLLFLCFLAERVLTRRFSRAYVLGDILGTDARPEATDIVLLPKAGSSPAEIDEPRALEMFSVRVRLADQPPKPNHVAVVQLTLDEPATIQHFQAALEAA